MNQFIGQSLAPETALVLIAIAILLVIVLVLILRERVNGRLNKSDSDQAYRTKLLEKVVEFFHLQNRQDLLHFALKPRSFGGNGKCEELAMVGDRVLNLVVVRQLLLRVEKVAKFVSREKIQQWVMTKKKECVTNETLSNFAYFMRVHELVSSTKPTNEELAAVAEALLGACAEIKGDAVACLVAKEMMFLMDNIILHLLKSLFQRSCHKMFKLVRVNPDSNSGYLRLKEDDIPLDPLAKAVHDHEKKLLKAGKPLSDHLLYMYEVSVEAYPALFVAKDHSFRGIPSPDSNTAKRSAILALLRVLWVIPNIHNTEGRPNSHYLCLEPSTNVSRGKYPILQFLRRSGENSPRRHGAPAPGSCGLPIYAVNPMTLATDEVQGLYSCHQNPPERNLHPCRMSFFTDRDSLYKHGGLISPFFAKLTTPLPVAGEKGQLNTRKRNRKKR